MTEAEIISIERACERLILDFAFFSDQREYESLAALFAEQGTMTRPSGDLLVGREAIIKSYRARPATRIMRHVCTNMRITVDSSDRARGWTYAVVYSADSGLTPDGHFGIRSDPRQLVGEFEDEFLRTPEGWRFASRIARFTMHTS